MMKEKVFEENEQLRCRNILRLAQVRAAALSTYYQVIVVFTQTQSDTLRAANSYQPCRKHWMCVLLSVLLAEFLTTLQ